MTTALPSVHGATVFANNSVGLPSYPGSHMGIGSPWSSRASEEGDESPMSGVGLGSALHSAPQFFFAPNLCCSATNHGLNVIDSTHRFNRERAQVAAGGDGGGGGARGPMTASALTSPSSYYSTHPPAASTGSFRCRTPDHPRRTHFAPERPERSETFSGWPTGGTGVGVGVGVGGSSCTSSGGAAVFPSTILPQASYRISGSGGGGGGGSGIIPGTPPSTRMITHDAFVLNRPIASASNAGERRRLFTGTSQELLRGAMLSAPLVMTSSLQSAAVAPCASSWADGYAGGTGGGCSGALSRGASLRSWAQPFWVSLPETPPACTSAAALATCSGSGEHTKSRRRARGASGSAIPNLSLPLPLAMTEAATADLVTPRDGGPYASLPLSASDRRPPSPRFNRLHTGGLGSATMSMMASGHHISRQQVNAQARGVERLLALDVEEMLAHAPTPRQITTLTPGSLDGMGHPVLVAADGARILKRIPDHLPRHLAERMVVTPMRPAQLSLALESALDPDLDLDVLVHSPDGGDGSSSNGEADFLPPARSGGGGGSARMGGGAGGNVILPLSAASLGENSFNGGAMMPSGGGGRPGTRTGCPSGARKGAAAAVAATATAEGANPQMMTRSWSSPRRQPRAGGGGGAAAIVHSRNDTMDGSGVGIAGSGGAGGGGLLAESTRSGRIGLDLRGGPGTKPRQRSRSPLNSTREGLSVGGRGSPGRTSPTGASRDGGGRRQSVAGDESGPPKWLGMYIPKEDPLGLWTGKRMSKTEVIVEKRLFAMRHNPGMRLELESRAADALRQRAAAQAEMAAVARAREVEALARRAQLHAEIEARRHGYYSMDLDRIRTRTPRGLTKEEKAALERRLLAEADAEPRGPMTREEAAIIIQSTWRMYVQRRRYLYIRAMVIRIQRNARLRYCVVRNRRRHAAAAALLVDFLYAICGNRRATAAADLREIHSNYIRRRLLEKKCDFRHQTAVAVLVREWDAVEARILGLRSRSLKGSALAAMAAAGFAASLASGGSGGGGGGGGCPDKGMLTAVAGEAHTAAHGTRLLGRALEARKKGVMLLGGGKDLNKQLTVEYAVAHALASDRVTLTTREPVPREVKALVSSCYLEHKSVAYTALIGVVWKRRARWFGVFHQQRHMAMARSVVATGSAWQAMDTLAKAATEKVVGPLPVLPRMRTSATLRELRAMMQAGVQEADLYTSYMLKGGIHEHERRLHSEMLLRNSFGNILHGRHISTPPNLSNAGGGGGGCIGPAVAAAVGPAPLRPPSDGGGRRLSSVAIAGVTAPRSPSPTGQRRISVTGAGAGPMGQLSALVQQPSTALLTRMDSPRRASRTVRIDASTAVSASGSISPLPTLPAAVAADSFLDTVSESGSEMTCGSNLSALVAAAPPTASAGGAFSATALARARFLSILPSQKAGVAQLKERWWRDAVVRADACLRKRYKQNGVSLVAALEDPTAPNLELFSAKLSEINSNPEKAEVLLAALPGSASAGTAGASGTPHGIAAAVAVAAAAGVAGTGGGGGGSGGLNNHGIKPRTSQEGAWVHRGP